MKNEKKVTRIVSLILAVAIMLVSLPMMAATAAPASEYIIGEKVADPSTFDSWKELFPANNTEWAGRVWTDKSVFTDGSSFTGLTDANGNPVSIDMHDQNNNFIVALSALASNKSIVGYSYTPTDTMLVLDVSGSMSDSRYVDDLVVAANSAIAELISLNKHNRVGVVLYSGSTSYGNSSGSTATVLLPLDRYTQEDNNFLVNSGQSSVSINSGVQNEAMQGTDRYLSRTSKSVSGGTYIQNGVYMAMEEFLAVTDTVVPDGEIQAGTPKIPIFVLMSDGLPTTATTNYAGQDNGQNTVGLGTSNLGDGGTPSDDNLKDAIDFVNQLTAAYALKKVDEHYADSDALFYTLGLGSNNNSLNSPVLNPSAHTNTNRHWENYVDTQNGSSLLIDIAEGWFPKQTTIKKLAEISDIAQ